MVTVKIMRRGHQGMSDQRILLLTASIGSGHIKAAEAIEEEIRKLTPQTKIIKVDFMSKRTSFYIG